MGVLQGIKKMETTIGFRVWGFRVWGFVVLGLGLWGFRVAGRELKIKWKSA